MGAQPPPSHLPPHHHHQSISLGPAAPPPSSSNGAPPTPSGPPPSSAAQATPKLPPTPSASTPYTTGPGGPGPGPGAPGPGQEGAKGITGAISYSFSVQVNETSLTYTLTSFVAVHDLMVDGLICIIVPFLLTCGRATTISAYSHRDVYVRAGASKPDGCCDAPASTRIVRRDSSNAS